MRSRSPWGRGRRTRLGWFRQVNPKTGKADGPLYLDAGGGRVYRLDPTAPGVKLITANGHAEAYEARREEARRKREHARREALERRVVWKVVAVP